MRDVLGYRRFVAQGGDWGAFVASRLGCDPRRQARGIHLNLLHDAARSEDARRPDCGENVRYQRELDAWLKEETGYSAIQGTRPQTLAFGLTDSPVGLAAWIVEKFRSLVGLRRRSSSASSPKTSC